MDINVNINNLCGTIDPISSKSTIHRSLICALLSRSEVRINKINFSKDVITTINILEKLNCKIKIVGNDLIVDSTNIKYEHEYLDCNESGSTLRFIIPVLLYLFHEAKVDGQEGLKKRPLDIYTNIFECDQNVLPIVFKDRLKAQEYIIDGNISSQFVSGLLFVLPLLEGNSKITFKTPLESKQYVDLTIDVLKQFNIKVFKKEDCIIINGNQEYATNLIYENEIDESNLAFFKVANELGSKIKFSDFNKKTSQPDAIIDEIIATKPSIVDVSEFPDLLPILAVLCCFNEHETQLINASRTRIKESNRLVAITQELNKIGANITIVKDSLLIKPIDKFFPGIVESHNDHRIAMSLVIASLKCENITITNVEAIDKSYPEFLQIITELGGNIKIL